MKHTRIKLLLSALLALSTMTAHSAEAPPIPFLQGLVTTGAAAWAFGDEESIVTLSALDDVSATFSIGFQVKGKDEQDTFVRRVRRQDLLDSHRMNLLFQSGDPESFPGSTFTQLSAASLKELKTKGEVALVLGTISDADYEAAKAGGLVEMMLTGRKYFRGTLKRVGTGTVPVSVLVNGVMQPLPAVEATGRFTVAGDSIEVHQWFLDQPDMALSLRSKRGQIVRIDYPVQKPEAALQATLASPACRAELHGIYFNTGSAFLLPQSDATLAAVASLLKANPSWKITVEGHTDNIGGAPANLTLSQARAESVRKALVAGRGVAAAQLSVKGYGLSKPVDSNATLEGRARNRRVELARACSP